MSSGNHKAEKNMTAQSNIQLVKATLADYPTIQNMARFYVYDMSRYCGHDDNSWALPETGLYESFDLKSYLIDKDRLAYLIKVNNELAGFILVNKAIIKSTTDWSMGEFFILARFQRQGIGQEALKLLLTQLPGAWEITIIPENTPALDFWRKVINKLTKNNYQETIVNVTYDPDKPKRFLLSFRIDNNIHELKNP